MATVVTTSAAAWFTRRFEQQSFVYGEATIRLSGDGSTMAAASGASVRHATGFVAATAANPAHSRPSRRRCSAASHPLPVGPGRLHDRVDRRRVVERVAHLQRADPEVVRDEVLVGLGDGRTGGDHRARGPVGGAVRHLGADHHRDAGAGAHGPAGAVDHLLLEHPHLGEDGVGVRRPERARPTSRPGIGVGPRPLRHTDPPDPTEQRVPSRRRRRRGARPRSSARPTTAPARPRVGAAPHPPPPAPARRRVAASGGS